MYNIVRSAVKVLETNKKARIETYTILGLATLIAFFKFGQNIGEYARVIFG